MPAGPRPLSRSRSRSRPRSRSDPTRLDAGQLQQQAHPKQPVSPRQRSGSLDSYHDRHSAHDIAPGQRYIGTADRKHRMSPTEKVYATTDEATTALRAERAVDPSHRPTPAAHVCRSRRHRHERQEPITPLDPHINAENEVAVYDSDDEDGRDGYDPAVRHMASHLSLRSTKSRVSFNDEHRSRDGSGSDGVKMHVIGVGNMQPNHRVLSRDMLRPALRGSSSRVNLPSGAGESESAIGITPYPSTMRQSLLPPKSQVNDKALPHRPISMMAANTATHSARVGDLHDVLSDVDRMNPQQADFAAIHERHELMAPQPGVLRRKSRRDTRPGQYDLSTALKAQSQRPKLRNFISSFSALSISQPTSQLPERDPADRDDRIGSRDRRDRRLQQGEEHLPPIHPAEDLALYLHRSCVPEWVDWPTISGSMNDSKRRGSAAKWLAGLNIPGAGGNGSHQSMGWEWARRLGEAMGNQQAGHGRRLSGWEGMRGFEQIILDCKF